MKLLDTNVCIGVMNGQPKELLERYAEALRAGVPLAISSVTAFELWLGAERSGRPEFNRRRVQHFLSGGVQELSFGREDARVAAELRAALVAQGRPIGPYDTLIAGQALARGLAVVTHNVGEFGRVPGLEVEDWEG